MTPKQLSAFLKKHELTQGDLCKFLYDQANGNDRNIISRWISGPTKPPRWLDKYLQRAVKYNFLKEDK